MPCTFAFRGFFSSSVRVLCWDNLFAVRDKNTNWGSLVNAWWIIRLTLRTWLWKFVEIDGQTTIDGLLLQTMCMHVCMSACKYTCMRGRVKRQLPFGRFSWRLHPWRQMVGVAANRRMSAGLPSACVTLSMTSLRSPVYTWCWAGPCFFCFALLSLQQTKRATTVKTTDRAGQTINIAVRKNWKVSCGHTQTHKG